MEKLPYLLVAEKSLLPIISKTVSSLLKYADPLYIYVVVPEAQLEQFRSTLHATVKLVSEETVLPQWPLQRVRSLLPRHPERSGWYLQQFLKLGFGQFSQLPKYVIWDADTVMLQPPTLIRNGKFVFNTAREYHLPYFATFRRLLGRDPTLRRSAISQYMLIESDICQRLQQEICTIGAHTDWIETLLASLPGDSISEFSEYETYANYVAQILPDKVELQEVNWFRYGAEIFRSLDDVSLENIESRFSGYAYVAFERHGTSIARRIGARLLLLMGR